MCGIFGWQLKDGAHPLHRRVGLAAMLAVGNDNRGGESWGYWTPEGKVVKGLEFILPFVQEVATHPVVLCHTRKATYGKVVAENSHPYRLGKVLGAHNGMVYNRAELEKKYKHREDFAVDSMHIFAQLDEGLPFDELEGYGAIQYTHDDSPGSIFLCRMKNGELSVRGLGKGPEDVKGIVWSSSDTHLKAALAAAGVRKHFDYSIKEAHQYEVKDGRLYETNLRKLKLGGAAPQGNRNQYGLYEGGYTHTRTHYVQGPSYAQQVKGHLASLQAGKFPTAEDFGKLDAGGRNALCCAFDDLIPSGGKEVSFLLPPLTPTAVQATA